MHWQSWRSPFVQRTEGGQEVGGGIHTCVSQHAYTQTRVRTHVYTHTATVSAVAVSAGHLPCSRALKPCSRLTDSQTHKLTNSHAHTHARTHARTHDRQNVRAYAQMHARRKQRQFVGCFFGKVPNRAATIVATTSSRIVATTSSRIVATTFITMSITTCTAAVQWRISERSMSV